MNSSNSIPAAETDRLTDAGYALLKQGFEALSGIRLDLYKENQMRRRINTLIGRKRLAGYEEFLALLQADPGELAAFEDYITINVTEFFRTPEQWEGFEQTVIPELLGQISGPLKIWSCACATGEEAYSLAIGFRQAAQPERFRILATDIDDKVLAQAEKGLYTEKVTQTVPPQLLERYFVRQGDSRRVSEELRSCVRFEKLDLLKDDYPAGCDLIVCRNVLIYFTEEAKNSIYEKMRCSLKPGGYLFTGNTEQIIYYKQFGLKKLKSYLYQKL